MRNYRFKDLPVGTRLERVDGSKTFIILPDNKYSFYIYGKHKFDEIITINSLTLREDQVIYPPCYNSPLWKVLNGEDI